VIENRADCLHFSEAPLGDRRHRVLEDPEVVGFRRRGGIVLLEQISLDLSCAGNQSLTENLNGFRLTYFVPATKV
jgi:hypothetical protein